MRGLTRAGWSLEEALWVRKTLLCSEGGRDICGEDSGLDFEVRSLGCESESECWRASQDALLLGCGAHRGVSNIL